MPSDFTQEPPALDDQYETDRVLRGYLRRVLPEGMLTSIEPELHDLGRRAGGDLFAPPAGRRAVRAPFVILVSILGGSPCSGSQVW
jgi:hypothetical protein